MKENNFIQTNDKEVRDELIHKGFKLLYEDKANKMFVFLNQTSLSFDNKYNNKVRYTNILTM